MEEIAKILPSILKQQVQRRDPPVVEILAPLWPRVAGKAMSECCQPVDFSAGTLTLATESACWDTQLRQMTEEIRAEINRYLGGPIVQRLRVQRVRRLKPAALGPEVLPASPRAAKASARTGSALADAVARSYDRAIIRRHRKEH